MQLSGDFLRDFVNFFWVWHFFCGALSINLTVSYSNNT